MSEGEKIFLIPDVGFDLSSGEVVNGSFSLFKDKNDIFGFEWIPNKIYDPNKLAENNVPNHVFVSFSHIAHIIKRELAFSTQSMKIYLTDSSSLPWFSFNRKYSLIVTHMFEFLVHKSALTLPKQNDPQRIKYLVMHKQRSDNDIFGYVPLHTLKPEQIVAIVEHNKILKKLNYQPMNEPPKRVDLKEFNDLLARNECQKAYLEICKRGLDDNARCFVWPILLGLFPADADETKKEQILKEKLNNYLEIKKQWNLITEEQFKMSPTLNDIVHVSENDVKRNDRKSYHFEGDDNPNLDVLRNVMRLYAIYNRDCGYVQGIGDIISAFIVLFIKEWDKEKKTFTLYDNKVRSKDETESFIFWLFSLMMETTQQDRIFGDLDACQQFVLNNAAEIAYTIHKSLKKLISESEITNVSFLFQSLLLLFKRDFKFPDVMRIWDSILSSAQPFIFPRYIISAILILLFPKLLIHTDGSMSGAMDVTGGFLENANVNAILQLSFSLNTYVDNLSPIEKKSLIQPIAKNKVDISYKPKLFKLLP